MKGYENVICSRDRGFCYPLRADDGAFLAWVGITNEEGAAWEAEQQTGELSMSSKSRAHALRVSPPIEHEWSVRLPNETQPAFQTLFDAPLNLEPQTNKRRRIYWATPTEVRVVRDDCAFMLDPLGPDLSPKERRAYLDLLAQCCAILNEPIPEFGRKNRRSA